MGTVTTITNKLLKPDISVTKKQYIYNAETKKYEEVGNGKVVKPNTEVIYILEAKNDGNKAGKVTIKDPRPANADNYNENGAWIDANKNFEKDNGDTNVNVSQLNGAGYEVTVPAKESVVIAYKVRVNGHPGKKVENIASYKDEDDVEFTDTEKVNVKIEGPLKVVPTTTEEGETITHKTVLILDYSSSMDNNHRLEDLKNTLTKKDGFFEKYFGKGPEGNGNELYIIIYNKEVVKTSGWINSANKAVEAINGVKTAKWTNTLKALETAKTIIGSDSSISVILMTDGEPTVDKNDNNYPGGKPIVNEQTIAAAQAITDKNKMYLIGFEIDEGNENVVDFVNKMAKPKEDGGAGAEYHKAENASQLDEEFQVIEAEVTNTDGTPFTKSSEDGIVEIDHGFEKNQDIEIYHGEYTQGNTPNKTYTWDGPRGFFATGYATYDAENNKILFNLGKYMEDEGLNPEEEVTIRFVAKGTSGAKTTIKSTIKTVNISSDPLPTLKKTIVEEKEEDKKVEKNKEVENDKVEENKEVENTEKEKVEEKEANKDEKEVVEEEKESNSDKEETEKEKVEEKEETKKEDNKEKENKEKEESKEEKASETEKTEKAEKSSTKTSSQEKTEKVEQETIKTEVTEENNN